MDALEKFFTQHREDFDDQSPDSDRLWSAIESQLPEHQTEAKHRHLFRSGWYAAAALLVLCIALGGILLQQRNAMNPVAMQSEVVDINAYYGQLISYKLDEVNASPNLSFTDKTEILNYLESLDVSCQALEASLKDQINNDEIIKAIVENYRKRLDVLENLLRRLNKSTINEDEKTYLL